MPLHSRDHFQYINISGIGISNVTVHFIGDPGQTVDTIETFQEILDNENALQTLSGGVVCVGGKQLEHNDMLKY